MISGVYSRLRFEPLTDRKFDSAHSVLRRTLKVFEKQVPPLPGAIPRHGALSAR